MTKPSFLARAAAICLGLTTVGLLTICFFLFESLRPRMILLEEISTSDLNLFNWAGICLVVLFLYFSLSLIQYIQSLKRIDPIRPSHLILAGGGVISFLLIFADFALLSDIVKQFRHNLTQPEWSILFPAMTFQFIWALFFLWFHLFGYRKMSSKNLIKFDSNIFLVVHFTGTICALMGIGLSSLGFFHPRAWSLPIHTLLSSVILLIPYSLVVLYWIYLKIRNERGQFLDEKQSHDLGKSALMTLGICTGLLTFLFFANYHNLGGILSQLWFPLYLFSVIFIFSLANLLFMGRDIL